MLPDPVKISYLRYRSHPHGRWSLFAPFLSNFPDSFGEPRYNRNVLYSESIMGSTRIRSQFDVSDY